MIKKRKILQRFSHSAERLLHGLKALGKKKPNLAIVEFNVRTVYNMLVSALEEEKNRIRNTDKKFDISKRKTLKQYTKIMREDLKWLKLDLKHGNVASGNTWITNLKRTLTKLDRIGRDSVRKEDREVSKVLDRRANDKKKNS